MATKTKRDRRPVEPTASPMLSVPGESMPALLARVVDYYNDVAKNAPELLAYLDKRGLRHAEVIDHFKIGYANRTLGFRIPPRSTKAGLQLRDQLHQLGILSDRGHEQLTGCLTVPVFSEEGEVLELYARKLNHYLQPAHAYLPARPDGRRGVLNLRAVKASKEIILCEGHIDALTFWVNGFRNVTSSFGVDGFTKEMGEAFVENGVRRVLVAYDADDAGNQAADRLAPELGKKGIEVMRVRFPRGMDANAYARKLQPAEKSLAAVIEGAVWMAGPRPVIVPDALDVVPQAVANMPASDPSTAVMDDNLIGHAPEGTAGIAAEPLHVEDVATRPIMEPRSSTGAEKVEPDAEVDMDAPTETSPFDAGGGTPVLVEAEVGDEEVRIRLGDRQWRVRGLSKATSYESLHVNLFVARGEDFFVDNLELYSARARAAFVRDAAKELKAEQDIIKSDVGRIFRKLEALVHQQITKALEHEKTFEMSVAERDEALALLKDPQLLDRIVEDFDRAGVVGEKTNVLVGYLAAISRKLEAPLAVVIQSSSAAGKSSLMQAVLRMMPIEDCQTYSAMTGQSLYYMGERDLANRILAIAEEEGAESASYALKLLQSEGSLSIASTGKDASTGELRTRTYTVRGPVMIFMTTTAIDTDPELLNRCLVLTVDEGPEQTAAIHARQREAHTLVGLQARKRREKVVKLHQNAQRLLEPLAVVNPLADRLRFTNRATRARRDHQKLLTLIDAIALLHQHQRPIQETIEHGERIRYIEVTEADIKHAEKLAAELLTTSDDLPPQTRRLLGLIEEMVTATAERDGIEKGAVRFTRREVRGHTRWSDAALKKHLGRLEDLEHLHVHGSPGVRKRRIYQLSDPSCVRDLVTPNSVWSPPGHALVTPGGCPEKSLPDRRKEDLVTLPPEALTRLPGNGVLNPSKSQSTEGSR